jgi:hypothetical protein
MSSALSGLFRHSTSITTLSALDIRIDYIRNFHYDYARNLQESTHPFARAITAPFTDA